MTFAVQISSMQSLAAFCILPSFVVSGGAAGVDASQEHALRTSDTHGVNASYPCLQPPPKRNGQVAMGKAFKATPDALGRTQKQRASFPDMPVPYTEPSPGCQSNRHYPDSSVRPGLLSHCNVTLLPSQQCLFHILAPSIVTMVHCHYCTIHRPHLVSRDSASKITISGHPSRPVAQ